MASSITERVTLNKGKPECLAYESETYLMRR